ncbi:IS1480 transposase [Xanthomonas oryzae pv. oryzae KACC 10331]|uniref:IS1480 transposase n=1 Tax=Xanthomonas oryzae pv. oryzae (strain KACC10331 / KXO85) TaxID=291331 RepID=Q5H610_XANOR|nr:IS1480 transposase [Xanthomonas oryzae pv. oryzae KACC 10331]
MKRCRSGLGRVKRLLCDSGYTGDPFAEGRTGHSGQACHRTDCQAQRAAYLQGHAQALECRTQLCLAGEEPEAMEELRAKAQYQLAAFIHLAFLAMLLRRS